jgi:hypothetical protein
VIDPLEWLWPLADAPVPTVGTHHTAGWPDDVLDRLTELGLLVECELAARVLCPECRDHYEEVLACEGPGRATYSFIVCPELHRVRVPRDARRQWSVSFAGLTSGLAVVMKLTGKVTELAPGRVWRLGRTTWHGESRDVVLARGLNWCDAASLRAAITRSRKPVVFVPHAKPLADFWSGRVPPVIALNQIATDSPGGIDIDPLEILTAVRDADAMQSEAANPSLTTEQLTLLIRRQIKAEHKSELTDDVYLAAYRQHGSMRKAAEFLSNETGTTISKDQVQRAVTRAGGAAEVLNAEDSDSVVRPVASRSRDRRGKSVIQSQTVEEE